MNHPTVSYYAQKKKYWLKFLHKIIDNKKVHQKVFLKYFKPEKIADLKLKTHQQFEELLPHIPDFGIKRNTYFSRHMMNTALSFVFYRILRDENYDVHTIGKILYEITDVYYMSLNPLIKFLMRRSLFLPSVTKKAKAILEARQNSVDPEDYHCIFIEGDNKNLLFGIDYTNCAGLHFLRHQNALELAPYLCLCDYPVYKAIKVGFNRSQNLAIGGNACSFRFYRNFNTPKGWPIEELDEYKNFKFTH